MTITREANAQHGSKRASQGRQSCLRLISSTFDQFHTYIIILPCDPLCHFHAPRNNCRKSYCTYISPLADIIPLHDQRRVQGLSEQALTTRKTSDPAASSVRPRTAKTNDQRLATPADASSNSSASACTTAQPFSVRIRAGEPTTSQRGSL